MNETHPREVLRGARQLVKSQQYEAALQKYTWFYDHALEFDQRLVGVRSAYAVAEWAELGEIYPPARRALESVRDSKTQTLMKGAHDRDLFHDVESINRAFGQRERTAELFKFMAETDREAAASCFSIALEALIHTKNFGFARTFLTDPRTEIDRLAAPLKKLPPKQAIERPEMFQEALIRVYVRRVGLIISAFIGVGEELEANWLRDYAVQSVPDAQLRNWVTEQI